MATVTGYTAAKMQAIEDEVIVDAVVDGSGHLILTRHDGSIVDAGLVKGPQGDTGATGATGAPGANGADADLFMGKCYGEAKSTSIAADQVALSTTSLFMMPNLKVTFTLTQQRRVRIEVNTTCTPATAVARDVSVHPMYVAGSSQTLTGAVNLASDGSTQVHVNTGATGGPGRSAVNAARTVVLAAGTYTAFVGVTRTQGGATTDFACLGYVAVFDCGPN